MSGLGGTPKATAVEVIDALASLGHIEELRHGVRKVDNTFLT
ncbi:hypothetical protein [Streptococcus pyogenes]|nr:hypothetical protein [Streptococcus pyogenes]